MRLYDLEEEMEKKAQEDLDSKLKNESALSTKIKNPLQKIIFQLKEDFLLKDEININDSSKSESQTSKIKFLKNELSRYKQHILKLNSLIKAKDSQHIKNISDLKSEHEYAIFKNLESHKVIVTQKQQQLKKVYTHYLKYKSFYEDLCTSSDNDYKKIKSLEKEKSNLNKLLEKNEIVFSEKVNLIETTALNKAKAYERLKQEHIMLLKETERNKNLKEKTEGEIQKITINYNELFTSNEQISKDLKKLKSSTSNNNNDVRALEKLWIEKNKK